MRLEKITCVGKPFSLHLPSSGIHRCRRTQRQKNAVSFQLQPGTGSPLPVLQWHPASTRGSGPPSSCSTGLGWAGPGSCSCSLPGMLGAPGAGGEVVRLRAEGDNSCDSTSRTRDTPFHSLVKNTKCAEFTECKFMIPYDLISFHTKSFGRTGTDCSTSSAFYLYLWLCIKWSGIGAISSCNPILKKTFFLTSTISSLSMVTKWT